jgi:uncharacterized membrane protein
LLIYPLVDKSLTTWYFFPEVFFFHDTTRRITASSVCIYLLNTAPSAADLSICQILYYLAPLLVPE